MTVGLIPINQQNALPLLSTTDATNPDRVEIVGSSIVKYWGPVTLGINSNMIFSDAPANRGYLVSPFLDFRGVNNFTFILLRTMASAAGEALLSVQSWAKSRATGVSGLTNANPSDQTQTGSRLGLCDYGSGWNVTGVGPYPYTRQVARGFTNNTASPNAPGSGLAVLAGTDLAVTIEASTVIADVTWSLHLWAQT